MNPHEEMLNEIRRFFKEGATIKATDPAGEILKLQEDGIWHGGLTIQFPPGEFMGVGRRITAADLSIEGAPNPGSDEG